MTETHSASINTQSILSTIFGVLAVFSSCMGMIPIPFTGFICFPTSFLCSILAVMLGIAALWRIKRQGENGSAFAWIGIIIGGFILLAMLCIVTAFAAVFIMSPGSIQMPPGFDYYQT